MPIVIAILPVFATILFGWFLYARKFVDQGFWGGAEKLTYFVLFPALLLNKMTSVDMSQIDFLLIGKVILSMLLIVSSVLILLKPWVSINNAQFSSIFQGGLRHNTYIGFAVIAALYGAEGLTIAAVLVATMIAILNVLCVLVMEIYPGEGKAAGLSPWRIARSLLTNPLLVTCGLGLLINVLGAQIPIVVADMLGILSHAALPLGLLTVGAALNIRSIRSAWLPIVVASMSKFIAVPVVAMTLCYYWNVDLLVQQVLLILCVVPTATSAYILAKQMGGDAGLMATIITAETLLAIAAMPLLIAFSSQWLF